MAKGCARCNTWLSGVCRSCGTIHLPIPARFATSTPYRDCGWKNPKKAAEERAKMVGLRRG